MYDVYAKMRDLGPGRNFGIKCSPRRSGRSTFSSILCVKTCSNSFIVVFRALSGLPNGKLFLKCVICCISSDFSCVRTCVKCCSQ